MSNEAKHTPGRMCFSVDSITKTPATLYIKTEYGEEIDIAVFEEWWQEYAGEMAANAERIVRAFNAHDDLLKACEAIYLARDYHADYGYYPPGMISDDQCFDDWAADIASKAIAKAEKVVPK